MWLPPIRYLDLNALRRTKELKMHIALNLAQAAAKSISTTTEKNKINKQNAVYLDHPAIQSVPSTKLFSTVITTSTSDISSLIRHTPFIEQHFGFRLAWPRGDH